MDKKQKNRSALLSKLLSRIPDKAQAAQKSPAAEAPRPDIPDLVLLFFIVDWDKANLISGVFEEEKVRFHFISRGKGTASSEMLDLLGIGAADKAVILCLEQTVLIPVLIKEARKKFNAQNSAGIAFTIPFSGINSPILRVFKQSIHKNEKIASVNNVNSTPQSNTTEYTHSLIAAIINQGCSDELMNTARDAGASGGTVLFARGQAHEGAVKFFGISVQDEREVVIMLTSHEKKDAIMQAVSESHGLGSNAQGIVFSMPVEKMMSLSSLVE